MKIKITQPGWEGYTGLLGMVEFADGTSIDSVSRADAAQLSAIVNIEDVETGRNPSDAQRIIDSGDTSAPVETPAQGQDAGEQSQTPAKAYTKVELEAIADKGGIKAVREVADTLGLKGNSISELIEKILSRQA